MLLGHMPMNSSKLLQNVVSKIPARAKTDSTTDWTKATKLVLRNLGRQQTKIDVYEEWLLDMVWYLRGKGGIQLAVESELGKREAILDDFEKLMCVKAPLKLFLIESGDSGVRKELEGYLAEFGQHIKGETYLLADFHRGLHDCYQFVVKRNGKQKKGEIKFQKITRLCGSDVPEKKSAAAHSV
jgi:hypothetical protein